jgi:hypothetical protein
MDSKLLTQHLIELEQLLVQPATRLSVELLNRHLADDFYEIAATGRCFGKADVLERLIRTNTFRHFAKRVQSLNEVNNVNKENPQNTYRRI